MAHGTLATRSARLVGGRADAPAVSDRLVLELGSREEDGRGRRGSNGRASRFHGSSASTRSCCGARSSISSPAPSSRSSAIAASSTGTAPRTRRITGCTRTPTALGVEIEWLGTPSGVPAGQPDAAAADGAPDGRGDRGGDRPPIPRAVQPGAVAPLRSVQYQTEDLIVADYLEAVSPVPRPGRARGAAGRRAVDLREPPGLDRRAAARHRARPGRPGSQEPGRCAQLQRPADGDQGVSPALRRRADGLPGRPPGGPGAADRRDPLGRGRPGERAAGPSLPSRLPRATPRPRAPAGTSAWC